MIKVYLLYIEANEYNTLLSKLQKKTINLSVRQWKVSVYVVMSVSLSVGWSVGLQNFLKTFKMRFHEYKDVDYEFRA